MMKSIFSLVAAAMLMTACVGSDEPTPSPDVTENAAVELDSQNVSEAEIDLADVDTKALQARYCRAGYFCCEPEEPAWNDGDQNQNECWICRPRNTPCP
jgi:hypothetical protein